MRECSCNEVSYVGDDKTEEQVEGKKAILIECLLSDILNISSDINRKVHQMHLRPSEASMDKREPSSFIEYTVYSLEDIRNELSDTYLCLDEIL